MAFSRHNLSIGKPADIQSFLTQRFSGKRRHRAARPQQTGKHLEKWRFVKQADTGNKEYGIKNKASEGEVVSLQTKISTTETKLQEKEVRIQQLEGEKVKLEETNTSLEKTNQALKMQLSAVESISQAQGKIIESLKKNKDTENRIKISEEKTEAKTPVEKSVETLPTQTKTEAIEGIPNPPLAKGEDSLKANQGDLVTPPQTETKPTEEKPKAIPVEEKSTAANQEGLAEAKIETPEEIPAATETPTAAEVFSEIPDERNPEKEKQTEVEAAEISQATDNETPTAKAVKSEETPTISEATQAEEKKTETTETEAGENSTEEKAASDSPAVETENAVKAEAEAAATNQEKVETPAENPAEEKAETETPAEAQSEVVESPAEVAQ
ncbi:MAG: hypothetical protein WC304_03830 [Candidatus Gracilibacteria bacterium]